MPKLGLVISFHISAASAGAIISGRSSMIEMKLLMVERRCRSIAMPRPSSSSSVTVMPA
ncbi:hypothetical protein D3C80_1905550 [compost metagenome]